MKGYIVTILATQPTLISIENIKYQIYIYVLDGWMVSKINNHYTAYLSPTNTVSQGKYDKLYYQECMFQFHNIEYLTMKDMYIASER